MRVLVAFSLIAVAATDCEDSPTCDSGCVAVCGEPRDWGEPCTSADDEIFGDEIIWYCDCTTYIYWLGSNATIVCTIDDDNCVSCASDDTETDRSSSSKKKKKSLSNSFLRKNRVTFAICLIAGPTFLLYCFAKCLVERPQSDPHVFVPPFTNAPLSFVR